MTGRGGRGATPARPGRRRFLRRGGLAILGALSLGGWWGRLRPKAGTPLRGREARWYRRVR